MKSVSLEGLQEAIGERYQVEALIAQGGMGSVFLAVHRELGSHVAIKVLPPEVRFDASRLERFRREASLAAKLSHPNLVPVFELEVQGDVAYLVMPYIEGMTLEDLLRERGQLSREIVEQLIGNVGDALAHGHARGVVHRDIKPANILLEQATSRWLVTDFGVAHMASQPGELTQTDATLGTLAYMAPEQFGGARNVDGRADLFSLAAVAYEGLAGVLPEREGPARAAEELHRRRPDLPAAYCRAVTRPLAEARDQRPRDVETWVASLAKPRAKTRVPWMVAGAAGALALALGGAQAVRWLSSRDGPSATSPTVAVFPFTVNGVAENPDTDSILSLAEAVGWQLRTLPTYQIIGSRAVYEVMSRRDGSDTWPQDSLVATARALGATDAVIGNAEIDGTNADLRIVVYDAVSGRTIGAANASGLLDSLHSLVIELVVDAFANRLAEQLSGTPAPSLPSGWPAITAYFEGDRAFRRGAFETADQQLARVIELDSTFAPAYLKRAWSQLFQIRPTEVSGAFRQATRTAMRHRDRLDNNSRAVLDAYNALIERGDVEFALNRLQQTVDQSPDAVDAWFLLGFLKFRFPKLTGAGLQEAGANIREAVRRDPGFAAAHLVLFLIATVQENPREAERAVERFLGLDSTSARADMLRLGDSLFTNRNDVSALGRIMETFPARSTETLENLALIAGELNPPPGARRVGIQAVQALLERSNSGSSSERAVAFRLRVATRLAAGDVEQARQLVREARMRGVPDRERDRWIVLGAATGIDSLADSITTAASASRLEADSTFVSLWLAARWAFPNARAAELRSRLEGLLDRPDGDHIIGRSLIADLNALELIAAGNPDSAVALWADALGKQNLEAVVFGILGSLWPLRLARSQTLMSLGRYQEAIAASEHFDRMSGFVDQVAWYPIAMMRWEAGLAVGDTLPARSMLAQLEPWLTAGGARRDSVGTLLQIGR